MAIYLTIKRSSLTGSKKPFGGKQPKFVEGQHARDSHGRFSSKPGGKSPKPQEIRSNNTELPDTGRPRKNGQMGWDSDDPIGTVVRAYINKAIAKEHDALYLLACQHDDFPRIMYYPLPEERDMDVARYFYDVEVLEAPTPSFNSDPNVVY